MQQYEPLFLKYRPQSLADLVGQDFVRRTLTNAIDHNRLSHAYLFTGARGTGKTSSARILAKCLNCQAGPTPSPCQACTSCVEIKAGISPAVLEIDAASNNSVDDARVLIERAPLVAPGGRYKLYIIDECHMLTKEAFNALLKTIEEPPANVIFVLATTEEHKVPQTIVSRCQRLIFRLVKPSDLVNHLSHIAKLENINIDSNAVDLIARRSGGGMRDALGLLDQSSLLRPDSQSITVQDLTLLLGALEEEVLLAMGKHVIAQDSQAALELAHQLLTEGKEPYIIASELAKHMLNLVKSSYLDGKGHSDGGSAAAAEHIRSTLTGSPQYIASLLELSQGLDRFEIAQIVEQLDHLEQACKRSSQPVFSLEIGLMSLCHRLDTKAIKAIQDRLQTLEIALSMAESKHDSGISAGLPTKANVELLTSKTERNAGEETQSTSLQLRDDLSREASVETEPLQGTVEAPMALERSEKQSSREPHNPSLQVDTEDDIDAVWTDLLHELQRRHLPTFSLVSTHAFPVSLKGNEFVLGVHFENFQKMIESKISYINEACQEILKRSIQTKVRVVSKQSRQSASAGVRAKPKVSEELQQVSLTSDDDEEEPVANAISERDAAGGQSSLIRTLASAASVDEVQNTNGINITHEAYSLFEGPGSRLITANSNEMKS